MPVTTLVVPGNCADDPLYVPEIKKVQRAFGKGGKTFPAVRLNLSGFPKMGRGNNKGG
jgi:hypothetical protein